MFKKSIIGLVAVIAAVGLVFAAYSDGDNSNSSEKSINTGKQNLVAKSNTTNQTSANRISEEEAQKIAQKYIEEPGAKAGKAKLSKTNGESVYVVPVVLNGNTVGEIYIGAQTGKNMGGAGGVS